MQFDSLILLSCTYGLGQSVKKHKRCQIRSDEALFFPQWKEDLIYEINGHLVILLLSTVHRMNQRNCFNSGSLKMESCKVQILWEGQKVKKKISQLFLKLLSAVKTKWEIFSKSLAISEYLNFIRVTRPMCKKYIREF